MKNKISSLTLRELVHSKTEEDILVYSNDIPKTISDFKENGIEIVRYYSFLKALGIRLNKSRLPSVLSKTSISYVTKVSSVSILDEGNKVKQGEQNSFDNELIDAEKEYNISEEKRCSGRGVTLAVLDTGIFPHLDFCLGKNRIKLFVDFINGKKIPYDDNGHGTFVTSLACGSGLVSNGKIKGVASKTEIVSLKCMDAKGVSTAYSILDCFEWLANNYKKYNISVVCMAFGSNDLGKNDPLKKGVKVLNDLGLTIVTASGNSGPGLDSIKSPGSSDDVITVGSCEFLDGEYKVVDFSSRSKQKPDVLASGVGVMGASVFDKDKKFYSVMSGTSISTGIVSGLTCLVKERFCDFTPKEVKEFLISNSVKLDKEKSVSGAGVVEKKLLLKNLS